MLTVPRSVAAISAHAGIPIAFTRQEARYLRELGFFPTRPGRGAAAINSKQLALLLVAAICGPGVRTAAARALQFGGVGLVDELSQFITQAANTNHPRLVELRVDVTNGRYALIDDRPPDSVVESETNIAVKNKREANAWLKDRMTSEAVLPGKTFYAIIEDINRGEAA